MKICDKCGSPIPTVQNDYKSWKLSGNVSPMDSGAKSYELCPTCFKRVLEFTESVWK